MNKLKNLWAPWRFKYIKEHKKSSCFFCEYPKTPAKDKSNLILYRGNHCFCIMNRFPYNAGHLMIAPYKHTSTLDKITTEGKIEIMDFISYAIKTLKISLGSQGFNIGANLGRSGGAGVPGHIHVHIVPRWEGDTNFMPILANTKVVIAYLQTLYDKLHKQFKSIANSD
ncbi:MAG: HIT domain-containing protein [Planctomycetes bacterium]|nr:HIT domain-containing protein [Planctomycetota bacterium]